MTVDELTVNFKALIVAYVKDRAAQSSLLAAVNSMSGEGDRVKAILARLDPWAKDHVTPEHARLIMDIYFNFC